VDSIPDPVLLRKSGSAGNRTQTSGSVARNADHYTTEAVIFQKKESRIKNSAVLALHGGTEECHENPQTGWPYSGRDSMLTLPE
jgi:hypothetical protein